MWYNKGKTSPSSSSTTAEPVVPGIRSCNLQHVPNRSSLRLRNLVILDLHCSKSANQSERCISKESFVKFTCEKGYVFANGRDHFNSLCLENGQWERTPNCVPSKYIKIYLSL